MKREEIFGKGIFVRPQGECVSPVFTAKFNADCKNKTEITVCGLGFFYLYINGKRVGGDVFAPVTSFYHDYDGCCNRVNFGEYMKSRIYAEKYDITEYVKDGENTLAVFTGFGWYANYSKNCVLCYKITNGKNEFCSDEAVKYADGPLTEFIFTRGEKQDFTHCDLDGILSGRNEAALKNCVAADIPETEYYIADCPNDKVIRSIAPVKIAETDDCYIYDAGENISGTCVFTCPEKGKTVKITVSEEIDENNLPHEKWVHGQTAEFICDGTEREYRLLFTWHAFRYFAITKCAENVRCDVIHTALPVIAEFECENDVLNKLFEMYIRTQLCNMHAGIPSDCPHLERRGYTGDGQLACEAAMLTLGSQKFYRKWIEDIKDCQDTVSGHIQYTAPYVRSGGGPGGWGCAIAEVPYTYYKMYGDITPFAECFDGMLKYLSYLDSHSENGLVVSDQPGEWCLGDWCTPHEKHGMRPEIPEPFVNNYFYIRTVDRMVELCAKIGRKAEIPALLEKRNLRAAALNKNYFDESTGDYAENLNSANAFAVDIGLGDGRTLANLVEHIRTKPLDTGIFGTDLVVKVLCENGFTGDAVEFLSREEYPSFGYMMKNGATTLWEEWRDPRSMSHPMFGSAVKYLFYYVLGIRQTADSTDFAKITVEPFTNNITGDVRGSIITPHGKITVRTDRRKNSFTACIPGGVKLC